MPLRIGNFMIVLHSTKVDIPKLKSRSVQRFLPMSLLRGGEGVPLVFQLSGAASVNHGDSLAPSTPRSPFIGQVS